MIVGGCGDRRLILGAEYLMRRASMLTGIKIATYSYQEKIFYNLMLESKRPKLHN
jgi:hypothetical protein